MVTSHVEIAAPRDQADIDEARKICLEYARSMTIDLCFQDFDAEMAAFPGKYTTARRGSLLLALVDGKVEGMIALRDLGEDVCEMKRLYIRPGGRGLGLGRRLCEALMSEARKLGYRTMRLDTLPSEHGNAIALYRALQFREIAPYYDNPLPEALYMEKAL